MWMSHRTQGLVSKEDVMRLHAFTEGKAFRLSIEKLRDNTHEHRHFTW